MCASFPCLRRDAIPQQPEVLYQDTLTFFFFYEGIHNKLRIFFYFDNLVLNICIMEVPGGSS